MKKQHIITDKDRDIRLNLDTMEEIPVIVKSEATDMYDLIGFVVSSALTE